MKMHRLFAVKGIHYVVSRFGPRKWRSLAFDGKYIDGIWRHYDEGASELADICRRYMGYGDILIMGCGGASILEDLLHEGLKSALGIDISKEAIRLASRFECERVSFQLTDMLTFDSTHSYDIILFSESLNYVPGSQVESYLNRLAGYLKPGGVFVVTFAQPRRYKNILGKIRHKFAILEDHAFPCSDRHLIVFNLQETAGKNNCPANVRNK